MTSIVEQIQKYVTLMGDIEMKNKSKFIYYYIKSKIIDKRIFSDNDIRSYLLNGKLIANTQVMCKEDINKFIAEQIILSKPFFVGRLGANELSAIRTFDFAVRTKYEIVMEYLCKGAGFFPKSEQAGMRFKELMLEMIPEADVFGLWLLPFEDYYLNKYGKDALKTTFLLDIEPWIEPENPWSAALKGKKVLVIHPFNETIERQYKKRKEIFPGTNILPEFELKTLKAVQTIAGERDARFNTWFDALEWMHQEALKIDFDIAIIGCGAYGFPLAAKLKKAGKQAIHLGGATQLMFGIKGKRWEKHDSYAYVQKFFNDAWVYPSDDDKPKDANIVEGGCYW